MKPSNKCQTDGCEKAPSYGEIGKKATHCATHGKELGFSNVKKKTCAVEDCSLSPCYGSESKKPTHCKEHGQSLGLMNVISPRCIHPDCEVMAFYGQPGTTKVTHCQKHGKLLGLVDVRTKRCEVQGCNTIASYGEKDSKKAKFCSEHGKALGLVDVINPRCLDESCDIIRSYGPENGRPTHCAFHGKLMGYIDLVNKKCIKCDRVANFGPPGGKVITCWEHGKDLQYVNLRDHNIKKCLQMGCNVAPSYGNPGGETLYCAKHGKPLGLVDIYHTRCSAKDCNKYPAFAIEEGKPATLCYEHGHALEYVRVNYRKCAYVDEAFGYRCEVQVRSPFDFCASHDPHRSIRAAETRVANFLRDNVSEPWTSWNRRVPEATGCGGAYRPDFIYDRGSWIVIVEVDEYQHARSDYSCENKRMVDIFNSYGGLPVIFLRINPDTFKISGRNENVSEKSRLDTLKDEIDYFLYNTPDTLFEIHRMFYDNSEKEYIQKTWVDFSSGEFIETPK